MSFALSKSQGEIFGINYQEYTQNSYQLKGFHGDN